MLVGRADSCDEVILTQRCEMAEKFYQIRTHCSDCFEVMIDGVATMVRARGKLKRNEILVGDYVAIQEEGGEKIITSIQPRKSELIRPSVANVDLIVLLVAPIPKADLYLVDKMIINCKQAKIDCVICQNKTDVDEMTDLLDQYGKDVTAVVKVSAKNNDIQELLPYLKGKLVCFAGQSAVGKSTLSNAIIGDVIQKTGEISEKIERGKNTTTSARIISGDGFDFIDTPGFSMLDAMETDSNALAGYYEEYVELSNKCKFHPCTHTLEPSCAIKLAVENGELNKERYCRYVKIYEEKKQIEKNKRRKEKWQNQQQK